MVAILDSQKQTRFAGKAKNRPKRDALLLPYQAAWVRDAARLKIAEKSRQIGWTWATAYSLVRRKSLKNARQDAWISSRDELQARLFLEDCKAFASLLQTGAKDLGERVVDDKGHSAFVLAFANGLRAHSMSSNPDAQAGKRGDRVLDEFALHPDPRKLYAVAYYGITWGGSLEIFSTHRGSANYFNSLVTEIKHKGNPKGFSHHRVTLQDALDQGFLFKLQQKLPADDPRQEMDEAAYFDLVRAESPDEETFLQECMCLPSDDASAFLSYELIQGCHYKPDEDWETDLATARQPARSGFAAGNAGGPLYVGVDVGRTRDLTVIWVLEKVADVAFTRRIVCLQNTPFDAQENALYSILALPGVRRCCIDNTGLGRQFAERAQKRFGTYKIEPITFTGPVKEELAYPVRAAFEDRSVRIPDDRLLQADLRAVRKETTAAGNIRFAAEAGKDGHADRFWALALALHAGKSASGPFAYSIVESQAGSRRPADGLRARRTLHFQQRVLVYHAQRQHTDKRQRRARAGLHPAALQSHPLPHAGAALPVPGRLQNRPFAPVRTGLGRHRRARRHARRRHRQAQGRRRPPRLGNPDPRLHRGRPEKRGRGPQGSARRFLQQPHRRQRH
jgi:phage FluMu gp28-like protein